MFGISGEHILVLGIILLFFGPRRLPELGNTLGKAIKNFKDAVSGVEEARYRKLDDKPLVTPPAPNPLTAEDKNASETTKAEPQVSSQPSA